MKKIIILAIITCISFTASGQKNDSIGYGYFKLGMTPAEIQQNYKKNYEAAGWKINFLDVTVENDGPKIPVRMGYRIINEKTASSIDLTLTEGPDKGFLAVINYIEESRDPGAIHDNFHFIREILLQKYGKPVADEDSSARWEIGKNRGIALSREEKILYLAYQDFDLLALSRKYSDSEYERIKKENYLKEADKY
jgi:hypothetical protein